MADRYIGDQGGESVYYRPEDGMYYTGSDSTGWTSSKTNPLGVARSGSAAGRTSIGSVGPSGGAGHYSTDYSGSRDEWIYRSARSMAESYMRGELDITSLGGDVSAIGRPDPSDYGSGSNGQTGYISESTYDFFVRYLDTYGETDPYVTNRYGAPPSRSATYGQDPNESAALQKSSQEFTAGENAKDRDFSASENEKDRAVQREEIASRERISAAQEAGATARVQMQVESDWKIAVMNDATRRYVAEGDWGTQKYVAELQEKGAMDRLLLELGDRDKDRAQRAQFEQNRHHEAMLGLVMEVAKYDADLAAQPRNWIAYASWLNQRDIVVNGLTLAMATDLVPEQAVNNPQMLANNGEQVAAAQTVQAMVQPGLTDGTSGGSAQPAAALGQTVATPTGAGESAVGQQGSQYTIGGVDLNSTDYGAIARQLLGMQPGQSSAPALADLQATYDATSTQGRKPGFAAWLGPTTNALGMKVNAQGQSENYRNWADMAPSLQDMRLAGAQSVGKWVPDFMKELDRSRPKGGAQTGVAGYA